VVSVVPDIADEKKRRGCKRRKHANLMSLDVLTTNKEIARVNKSALAPFRVASMAGKSDRGIIVSPKTRRPRQNPAQGLISIVKNLESGTDWSACAARTDGR
jgi:hypothetical protein